MRYVFESNHKWYLSVLAIFVLTANLRAQPIGHHFVTLEAHITNSAAVAVGSIESLSEVVLVKPGEANEDGVIVNDGVSEFTISLAVEHLVKGKVKKKLKLQFRAPPKIGLQYRRWSETKLTGLWLLGPEISDEDRLQRKPGGLMTRGRTWRFFSLSEAEDPFEPPPIFANNLSLLDSKADILARVREYSPIDEMDAGRLGPRTHSIKIPNQIGVRLRRGNYYFLTVALDHEMEKTAQSMIDSPGSFFSKKEIIEDASIYHLRMAGIELLRHYKSKSNQKRIRKQFDIPLQNIEGSFPRVLSKAYEVLLSWNIELPTPEFADEITSIDLGDAKLTTSMVSKLCKLKQLDTIKLKANRITDETLEMLGQNDLLHRLSQAMTARDQGRPKSAAEVSSLFLAEAPVSARGIESLTVLENLKELDLRGSIIDDSDLESLSVFKHLKTLYVKSPNISDSGLSELRHMKKLTTIFVGGAKITRQGLKQLKMSLPNCRITLLDQ